MAGTAYEEQPGVLAYRVRQHGEKLKELEDWRRDVDTSDATQKEQLVGMGKAISGLSEEVKSLRRVIVGFALTVAGSAVVFAFSILLATGKIG